MEPAHEPAMESGRACRKPSNKITDIVRLQRMLRKWKKMAAAAPKSGGGGPKKGPIGFLKRTLSFTDASALAAAASSSSSPGDGDGEGAAVPKGFLAVCVGRKEDNMRRRFVIPAEHLGHRAFAALLQEAEEEFGFRHEGVLRIPCEVSVFEGILAVVQGC